MKQAAGERKGNPGFGLLFTLKLELRANNCEIGVLERISGDCILLGSAAAALDRVIVEIAWVSGGAHLRELQKK